jgi:hypothetical protein
LNISNRRSFWRKVLEIEAFKLIGSLWAITFRFT